MDQTDTVLLGVVGVVVALVLAMLFASGVLFGLDESVARPLRLLAVEPFAWIVIAALIVAVLGHAYIDG
jgi:Na+-translocating ferredoxin:NAD+ oxidoreductase RnfA subunit